MIETILFLTTAAKVLIVLLRTIPKSFKPSKLNIGPGSEKSTFTSITSALSVPSDCSVVLK